MTFPGTCDAGECLNGIGITAIFEYHVGKDVAESITDFCICNSDTKFGAFCEQDISAVNETLIDCNGNGKFNGTNTITGCSCRDENNNATKFHGWHCEISNMDLCDQERISHKKWTDSVDDKIRIFMHQHINTNIIGLQHLSSKSISKRGNRCSAGVTSAESCGLRHLM